MGKIIQINAKEKKVQEVGLPKFSIEKATITRDGLRGDFNNYRHNSLKDTPDQALLVMPIEMINKLNEEGWPIKPGDIGENLTTSGIAYNDFQPEKVFKAGEVEFQITYACTPCNSLKQLPYVGKEKGEEFLKTMMDRRGWYAKVLKEGNVKVGDVIEKL